MTEALAREIERLDLLLYREVLRLRETYALSLEEFRGLHVGDELVERLLGQTRASAGDSDVVKRLGEHAEAIEQSLDDTPIRALGALLGLTPFECDVVLLAAAAEIDLKYELVLAYVNNDVAKKLPTVDLALRLFSGDPCALQRNARLFLSGILEPADGPRAGRRLSFGLSPAVSAWLFGMTAFDPSLIPYLTAPPCAPLPDALSLEMSVLADGMLRAGKTPIVVVASEGEEAGAAAVRLLSALGHDALCVEPANDAFPLAALCLVAKLSHAGVIVKATDGQPELTKRALGALHAAGVPALLVVKPGAAWRAIAGDLPAMFVAIDPPSASSRRLLWTDVLCRAELDLPEELVSEVAHQFRLGPTQIASAVASLCVTLPSDGESASDPDTLRDRVFRSARDQSTADLGTLATRVKKQHTWSDLVLPAVIERRLHEVARAARSRGVVFGDWGFASGGGHGLMVLFAGASGTGKTMSASVIARDVGLDLYRIDLASVVSKYIGETEKNLSRIFEAARAANVVLFFDEADALLGKRSAVKDAHDRYANIEVAYLLQKMEEHDGVVILASNLAKNMDAAFSRRMHFAVEFPRPDPTLRLRLWRGMFGQVVPLADDIDFGFLARQFELTGGEIRTIALDAAFAAASAERPIEMSDLVTAVGRQMQKQGKPLGAGELKHHKRPPNPS